MNQDSVINQEIIRQTLEARPDASLQDLALATGLSRERTRQIRLKLGLGPSPYQIKKLCIGCNRQYLGFRLSSYCPRCQWGGKRCIECGAPSKRNARRDERCRPCEYINRRGRRWPSRSLSIGSKAVHELSPGESRSLPCIHSGAQCLTALNVYRTARRRGVRFSTRHMSVGDTSTLWVTRHEQ